MGEGSSSKDTSISYTEGYAGAEKVGTVALQKVVPP